MDGVNAANSGGDLVRLATDFYTEVVRVRRIIEGAPDDDAADGEPGRGHDPEALMQRLQAVLEAQQIEVARRGVDFLTAEYREVQYLLAALADDIFLHEVEWAGRDVWADNVLEYRLFRSRSSGDRVFARISELVRSGDNRGAAMAQVYLMALQLGFRGRFRAAADQTPVREYMRQLFIFMEGRPPDLENHDRLLVPEAYAYTVVGQQARGLRLGLDWPWVAGGIVAVAVALSFFVWLVVTADLGGALDPAFDAARTASR